MAGIFCAHFIRVHFYNLYLNFLVHRHENNIKFFLYYTDWFQINLYCYVGYYDFIAAQINKKRAKQYLQIIKLLSQYTHEP